MGKIPCKNGVFGEYASHPRGGEDVAMPRLPELFSAQNITPRTKRARLFLDTDDGAEKVLSAKNLFIVIGGVKKRFQADQINQLKSDKLLTREVG